MAKETDAKEIFWVPEGQVKDFLTFILAVMLSISIDFSYAIHLYYLPKQSRHNTLHTRPVPHSHCYHHLELRGGPPPGGGHAAPQMCELKTY